MPIFITKHNKSFLVLGNCGFLSGSSQNLINNSFFHLRYNRKRNKILKLEIFTLILQNPVTKIDYRILTGAGPRFKLAEKKKFRLYVASLDMHEYERELKKVKTMHNDLRSNSYVSFSFQPNDYRILDPFKFSVKAGKIISIGF